MRMPLLLIVAGVVLIVAGDLAWLWRQTTNRTMDMRVTGTLIGAGAALVAAALLLAVLEA